MNQITDKVKDLVEVRSNEQLEDFIADLAQTLSGYYFTDITSDLMAKWIDRVVVMPTGVGNAYALAGYRGVGKSHFLATFGAILSRPELRAKLKDSHVFASAERLTRRHYPVIHVRRGTRPSLFEELQASVAVNFEVSPDEVGASVHEIIKYTSEKGGAGPSVLIIDTDLEREARVTRDDGPSLSEIAKAAEGTNVFVAVALDDDVATADGRNSSIASSFTIDYLDHEHLYKILDAHIFPKNNAKRGVITEIFENFRSVLPSFRWSEQRTASVYPLHPIILETAPFVRLFVQDFSLLAFASESGAKVLNRPADSLIALDELFDRVEKGLRKSDQLADVFETYDSLNEKVISKSPVMERLRAKLVLKGLLLLSLDSEGATASDITAAMLIFDERDPASASTFVENLLEKLVTVADGRLWKMEREGRAVKYGFNLSGKEHFNTALAEAVQTVPDSVVPALLKRLMRDRYSDCEFTGEPEEANIAYTDIEWRGGVRRGRLVWQIGSDAAMPEPASGHPSGWEILIDFEPLANENKKRSPFIQWKPDALKPEEFDALRRYHALMSREDLQQTFRDEVRTTIQTYTIAIEKIWERKFLQYGKLVIDGDEYPFTAEAVAGHDLSSVFGAMLGQYFEGQFVEHPVLGGRLEMSCVDELSRGLFAARESISPDVQKLAEAFAVPLGLADIVDGAIEVRPAEGLLSLHPVSALMDLIATTEGPVGMETLQTRLGSVPFGLTFEAQCLLLTALVARGVVEFVTTGGDRIGSRSLDLKLVWTDIAGIAVPGESDYSDDRLLAWASLLTGDKTLNALGTPAGRDAVKAALGAWLASWNDQKLLERLESVSDDLMTTELWHLGSRVRKSFGAAADSVSSVLASTLDLDAGLRQIEEAFSGSQDEFALRERDVERLSEVVRVVSSQRAIKYGVQLFESADWPEVDQLRRHVADAITSQASVGSIASIELLDERWTQYQAKFGELLSSQHDTSARSHEVRDRANEILATHEWWIFENLSDVKQFPTRFRRICRGILRELRKCNCTAVMTQIPGRPPFCSACGYSPRSERVRRMLCAQLWETVNQALGAYEHVLGRMRDDVTEAVASHGSSSAEETSKAAAASLAEHLKNGLCVTDLSEDELRVLRIVLDEMSHSSETDMRDLDEGLPPVFTAEQVIEDAVVVN